MFKVKEQLLFKVIFLFLSSVFLFIYQPKIYAYPLLNKNSTGLYTELKEIENAKYNIIITHGIAESSKEYETLANYLNQFHYNVLLYDIRSHGQSRNNDNNIADIDNFHNFIDDLHLIINSLKQKNNLKNILIGHSLGGMINNCYVYKYNDVDAVINSGTPTKIIDSVQNFINEENIKNMDNIPLGMNDEKLSRLPLTKEMKNFRTVNLLTPNFIRNTMVLSIGYFEENLINNSFHYPVPILLLHGEQDQVILPENSKELFNLLQNKNKKLKLYPLNYHNLFNDLENEKVYKDIIQWLEKLIFD
ncbi:MAG: alpha/beta fold hydrolase [Candidatus Phytoplasma stylosanthis]|uniref:alpha/beta fold hydrolase n=1 Tax=Candidatus Phytoplasma stylosanthis TaxID=2798314 RepID=UPI002939E97C|nr:alpha/beta fold hydrolase [Candidatus Phytoplasma stylosanthis]MDV3168057.1 alpha/beta fold hydrolase [Candidatus Phytoplasma stylosanthis]MDV3170999.1 alpha/beta fold hydrolase [Candidatus Phytoplasma stylosanthis]MDV3173713.1 alpha/beta fold hydrolase [Candidatus Phytoplasma stylosanthis]MDV3174362.1 alpha/beta fold hydrolase [Candidatus Phytoplasma stylosanthis]MDV3202499.1 alpha/beta fold hydrolase [Candidatus Phytoplasma stylosanthis]